MQIHGHILFAWAHMYDKRRAYVDKAASNRRGSPQQKISLLACHIALELFCLVCVYAHGCIEFVARAPDYTKKRAYSLLRTAGIEIDAYKIEVNVITLCDDSFKIFVELQMGFKIWHNDDLFAPFPLFRPLDQHVEREDCIAKCKQSCRCNSTLLPPIPRVEQAGGQIPKASIKSPPLELEIAISSLMDFKISQLQMSSCWATVMFW